ncbi:MAG: ribosome biogenesis GTPase YlqF [Oscillospiraceae bacterium]|nr:ribosome biogenesis GTPase YlqF [Oscillospiraceae bacterium]
MQIQWYPGHMAKARRQLIEQLRRVDAVAELCDARLPRSSRNPDLDKLCADKHRALVLNKTDLADPRATDAWLSKLQGSGVDAIAFDALKGRPQDVLRAIERASAHALKRAASRGINKTIRVMVVGVPNVGKSAFINRLSGRASARTADRPGVTRAPQWVRVTDTLELLDTPGLLWPRIDDADASRRLAYLGAIRDEILDQETLAEALLNELMSSAPESARARFKLPDSAGLADANYKSTLEAVCVGRGYMLGGGRLDTARAAAAVLDEFRAGKLGRITLERA